MKNNTCSKFGIDKHEVKEKVEKGWVLLAVK
jgi:hypothetical protein